MIKAKEKNSTLSSSNLPDLSQRAIDVLNDEGILARILNNFSPRLIQQTMAEAVADAITENESLVIEAGTGTGKTFAYLVPALLSAKKVIISTGTKNLQEQLFYRDLPLIHKALGLPRKIAILKGRANYVCWQRLSNYYRDGRFSSKQLVHELQLIKQWAGRTLTGDISELADINEDSTVWHYATSTVDNCLGQECPFIDDCFLVKARRQALEADILIINHHLFFADVALRDVGFGELLPNAEVIIFDEAHQLSEIASDFFGEVFSSRQLMELIRDSLIEQADTAPDMPLIKDVALDLEQAIMQMRNAFGLIEQKSAWSNIMHKPQLKFAISALKDKLDELTALLKMVAERSKEFTNCQYRSEELAQVFNRLTNLAPFEKIHWYETTKKSFRIHLTPLTVADHFQEVMQANKRAWVFTSATLAVNSDFSHYLTSLGLQSARTIKLDSPFDYQKQTLLYIPANMPAPEEENYLARVIEETVPVLLASKGRAFFLFTSHRALQYAAKTLALKLPYPLLIQGSMPKAKLLQQFCKTKNAVLLGTGSFWEGVDVRGEALSCVIIDKLPFAAPDDPVLKTRLLVLKKQGIDPFTTHQLPRAVIALKQGVGRLIRDCSDRGVLMIADNRLLTKDYGETFFNSLPLLPITRDLTQVQAFFKD